MLTPTFDRGLLRIAVVRATFVTVFAVGAATFGVRQGWIRSVDWVRVSLAFPLVVVVLYLSSRNRR